MADDNEPCEPNATIRLNSAEVERVDLEGGYFRLRAADGSIYLPDNFGDFSHLQQHGLHVQGVLRKRDVRFDYRMGGEAQVHIVSLREMETAFE